MTAPNVTLTNGRIRRSGKTSPPTRPLWLSDATR